MTHCICLDCEEGAAMAVVKPRCLLLSLERDRQFKPTAKHVCVCVCVCFHVHAWWHVWGLRKSWCGSRPRIYLRRSKHVKNLGCCLAACGTILAMTSLSCGGCWQLSLTSSPSYQPVWHTHTLCLILLPLLISLTCRLRPHPACLTRLEKKKEGKTQGLSWPHMTSCLSGNHLLPLHSHCLIKVFLLLQLLNTACCFNKSFYLPREPVVWLPI